MGQQDVDVSCVDGVGRIEIRRPHRRNAVDTGTALAIGAGLASLAPDCAAVLLCGQGGDLSSGADLKERLPQRAPGTPSARTVLLADIAASPVPVIAVVDGWAIGLGMGLAGAATFTVAGSHARFCLPEVRQGCYPYQVVPYLARRVAPTTVLRWALSGGTVGATEAAAAGLVTTVCAPGEAEPVARALATGLASGSREVVEAGMRWWHETIAGRIA